MPCLRWKRFEFVVLGATPLVALALLLAGCGGSRPGSVIATGEDFSFKMDQTHAPAGPVLFTLKNDSKTYQHEFWIYPANQPRIQDLLAAKHAGKANETDFLQGIAGRIKAIDPDATASAGIPLQAGRYEFACFVTTNIAGKDQVHYELGMHGTFAVP
jgi:uncharacterized cupredoxin-like copper-binding protein